MSVATLVPFESDVNGQSRHCTSVAISKEDRMLAVDVNFHFHRSSSKFTQMLQNQKVGGNDNSKHLQKGLHNSFPLASFSHFLSPTYCPSFPSSFFVWVFEPRVAVPNLLGIIYLFCLVSHLPSSLFILSGTLLPLIVCLHLDFPHSIYVDPTVEPTSLL
ncbi:hypothetical protein K435DRAFT_801173 [Dendrothele bispora CBS 962.96]|uniref:Uncharacterized protein n=1 Tax=Dendrothele bispora (strain CBS 962.96) TaxID=1314807 RepID=A0A4S8LBP3_DENBC|nr:hypothetical protein K435DRAFT_924746 [Dendrothele bispora CBS 962.96]THU91581.1 hypothetical protein K435DRAFT_801173 [Dendrothele bispora CBS 962.96]